MAFINSRKQGDWGLGQAIAWATSKGYHVSVPLTESQAYDLVIDDGELKRVEVKTTTYRQQVSKKAPNGYFLVNLRTFGGNRSRQSIRKLSPGVDALFIVTGDGTRYFIPRKFIGGASTIRLGPSYDTFKIGD